MNKNNLEKAIKINKSDTNTNEELNNLSKNQKNMQDYLEESNHHSFQRLMFELTYKNYTEEYAKQLWCSINSHREQLKQLISRDVGILVAALDYLYNIEGDLVQPTIIEMQQMEETASIATTDFLTGLFIRDVFDVILNKEVKKGIRNEPQLSLLMIDIDNFKSINDRFGHQEGDFVLEKIGRIILSNIREYDTAARYGGEEFAVILPETNSEDAFSLAERIRLCILDQMKTDRYTITVSTGVGILQVDDTVSSFIQKADQALYKAKESGKNRTIVYEKF